jgi:hypothetical protein
MSNHDSILKQAERMRNTLRDWLDQPGHAQARTVQQGIERLISDTRGKKSREALDNDLKQIISSLERVEEEVMDHHHSDQLINMCDDLRREASKL